MWLLSLSLLLCIFAGFRSAHAQLLGPNLIPNPSFESSTLSGMPSHWHESAAPGNTGTFAYPALPAKNGLKAARIDILSYAGGDVKWAFDPVAVEPGDYLYIDWYKATAPSVIEITQQREDGTVSSADVAVLAPAALYTEAVINIPVSPGIRALSVAHLLRTPGSLTLDDTWLALREAAPISSRAPTRSFPYPRAALAADLAAKPANRSRR